jgi:hypothetical protein
MAGPLGTDALSGDTVVTIDDRRVRLSNLDKVLYPATGTTKGEILHYLAQLAPAMLPHATRRPATRKRWPDGTGGQSFFQKNAAPGTPSWVALHEIRHKTSVNKYVLVDDLATLASTLADRAPEVLPMLRAQVHDEIVLSVPAEYAPDIAETVVNALSFEWKGVPIMADASPVGASCAAKAPNATSMYPSDQPTSGSVPVA